MKNLILLAAVAVSLSLTDAQAAPYFRPGLNEVKAGGFQALGESSLATGFLVPVIVHKAEDGHLFVPGVTWNLLDAGFSRGGGRPDAVHLGPSVNLDEPVKAAMRAVCRLALPGWDAGDRYGFLRSAFAPEANGMLSLGPSFRLSMPTSRPSTWTGGWDFAFTLSKRFGEKP